MTHTCELPALLFAATLVTGNLLAVTCEGIASLKLPDTTITIARIVAAGEFSGSESTPTALQEAEFRKLPAFCRVQGVIRPSSDSNVEFEVWLPVSGWNGRYLGVGNGGFAGSINYFSANGNAPSMAQALAAGYAASSTDTGHKAAITDADWAVGHPEKVIDYGYRAVHATAVDAKKIIAPALNTMLGDHTQVVEASFGEIHGAIRALATRAVESGEMRGDLDPIDLLRAIVGVSTVGSGPDWQQSAKRLVDILIAGSRPTKR